MGTTHIGWGQAGDNLVALGALTVDGDTCHQVWWHRDHPWRLGTCVPPGLVHRDHLYRLGTGWGQLSPGLVALGAPVEAGDRLGTTVTRFGGPGSTSGGRGHTCHHV